MISDSQRTTRVIASIVTGMGAFLTPFLGSAINIALPAIGREFQLNTITIGWIATVYLLTAVIFLVPIGRLADIYGRKRIFRLGTVIFTLASLACGFSNSALMLIATRILQGIGSPMIFGTGVAILTSIYPAGQKGKAIGINTAAVYLGLSTGPFLGGLLTQYLGWRSIFFLAGSFGLIAFILVYFYLRDEWAEARGEKFDWQGAFIYGLMISTLMYGFSRLPDRMGFGFIGCGALGSVLFIWWEMRVVNPVLEIRLFRSNTVFALSNLAALINYSATFAVGFLLSLYLQYVKYFSPRQAGLLLVIQPLIQTIFSPITGRFSDKIEPRLVASAGMGITSLGLLALTFIQSTTPVALIAGSLFLLGMGFAFFSSPNTNAVMSSVERRFYGVASGTLGTMRLTGQMLSLGISLLIISIYVGQVRISPDNFPQFLKSIRTAFAFFAGICFIGILASLARGKVQPTYHIR